MTGHTKEPWGVYRQPISGPGDAVIELIDQVKHTSPMADAIYLIDAGGKCPATTGCGMTSEANARRIVACVNALATIPDPKAYIAAARGMREALAPFARAQHIIAKVEEDGRIRCILTYQPDADETFTLASLDNARTALLAFDAAQGEQ